MLLDSSFQLLAFIEQDPCQGHGRMLLIESADMLDSYAIVESSRVTENWALFTPVWGFRTTGGFGNNIYLQKTQKLEDLALIVIKSSF